jgi:multidrug efflux system membrane fusion protein
VATAEQVDIPVTLEALGTVTPAAVATVRPQVSGVLQKINFTEGQVVRAGQVLATIDPRQSKSRCCRRPASASATKPSWRMRA